MGKVVSSDDFTDEIASTLWSEVQRALDFTGARHASLPEDRTERQDWVREGLSLPR